MTARSPPRPPSPASTGLTTIVGESGPYDYYDYTRSNGVIQRANHYVSSLALAVTNPDRQAYCKPVRDTIDANDADATGDFTTPFWSDRNYVDDAAQRQGQRLARARPSGRERAYRQLLPLLVRAAGSRRAEQGVAGAGRPRRPVRRRPRGVGRLPCTTGSTTGSQGVQNGVMSKPQVHSRDRPGQVMTTAPAGPSRARTQTQLFLKPGANAGTLGLAPRPAPSRRRRSPTAPTQRETAMLANPTTVTANRRVFLSPPLTKPVRISGTPVVQLDASVNKTSTHFGAILVDYGPAFPRVKRDINPTACRRSPRRTAGASRARPTTACYKDVGERHRHHDDALARDQGRARLRPPHLALHDDADRRRPALPVQLPAAAVRLHVPGRAPDRRRDRRLLPRLRHDRVHHGRGHHVLAEGLARSRCRSSAAARPRWPRASPAASRPRPSSPAAAETVAGGAGDVHRHRDGQRRAR